MSKFEFYKFVHIAAAIIWVGGASLAWLLTERMKKADQAHRLGFARDMELVSLRVFNPAAIVTLLFGILMVLDADALDFQQAWITIGFTGIAVSAALGMGFFGPQAKKLVAELASDDSGAVARVAKIAVVSRVDVLILFFVVWAMVTKPGL